MKTYFSKKQQAWPKCASLVDDLENFCKANQIGVDITKNEPSKSLLNVDYLRRSGPLQRYSGRTAPPLIALLMDVKSVGSCCSRGARLSLRDLAANYRLKGRYRHFIFT